MFFGHCQIFGIGISHVQDDIGYLMKSQHVRNAGTFLPLLFLFGIRLGGSGILELELRFPLAIGRLQLELDPGMPIRFLVYEFLVHHFEGHVRDGTQIRPHLFSGTFRHDRHGVAIVGDAQMTQETALFQMSKGALEGTFSDTRGCDADAGDRNWNLLVIAIESRRSHVEGEEGRQGSSQRVPGDVELVALLALLTLFKQRFDMLKNFLIFVLAILFNFE
mmetsp:Transcript_70647/g.106888  ORF Transcript_70647/g.106888 Transcript_70647/m.106888 type:complete len:220 (-) Transcript_70647:770-1429(-)